VKNEAAGIQHTAEDYLTRMKREAQVNPVLLKQFSVNIARSRQSDMCISEYGEAMADISLGYIAQASSLWSQIVGAAKEEGASKNENNTGDAACPNKQADTVCK